MAFSINKIKLALSDKRASTIIILLAIVSRIIQLIFFYNIRVDASYQVMATQNFVDGHGVSTSHVLANDLSASIYQPLINWPPGYSLLLSPFYWLFKPNYIIAGITLDIIAAITLILVSRAILRLFSTPTYLINSYTLLTSFFVYYFYFIASSDAIAISLFIVALHFTLLVLKTESKWVRRTIIIGICLLLCALIKYLFVPVVFVIPLFLILKGFFDNHRKVIKAGFAISMILIIGIGALLIYQKTVNNSIGYISQPQRGFYPQHLLDAYPFLPASFLKPDTLAMLLGQQSKIDNIILHIYQFVHILLAIFAAIYVIRIISKKSFKNLSLTENYFFLLFFLSLAITSLLAVLSTRVAKEEILPGWFWTYIEEPRYYGLTNVMIHIGVFILYQCFRNNPFKKSKYVFYFLILLLLPETFRGMIFNINRIRLFNKEEYSWQYEDRFQKYAAEIIKKEKQPTEKVIVTGSWYYMNHRVSLYSHAPILDDVHKINDPTSLNSKTPVLLLVILREKDLQEFRPFLLLKKEVVGHFNDFTFYTIHVTPH